MPPCETEGPIGCVCSRCSRAGCRKAARYGVVAGTGRLLELIRQFRFGDSELDWLRANVVVRRELDWLADYRFNGEIWGYREGEAYFPGSPC